MLTLNLNINVRTAFIILRKKKPEKKPAGFRHYFAAHSWKVPSKTFSVYLFNFLKQLVELAA